MYKILICPNAYKGSLTAVDAAEAIREGVERARNGLVAQGSTTAESLHTDMLPLADGGDGTLATLTAAAGGEIIPRRVTGPLGWPVDSAWGRLSGDRSHVGIVEMALASGLALLRPEDRDPLHATTFGTGELIRAAVEAGCTTVIVGIGGSATNDGGAGMAAALGVHFTDARGRTLGPGGAELAELAHIDTCGLSIPSGTRIIVASDVDNPLCGPEGASAVYGPQKGATPEMVRRLDLALAHYAERLTAELGVEVAARPGSGAAGGLGAGLMAFFGATARSGLEIALEVSNFDERLAGCRMAITGEGRLDGQTARGKVIAGVSRRARAVGVPAFALPGGIEDGVEEPLYAIGLTASLPIVDRPMPLETAIRDARRLLIAAAERLVRIRLA